tara:strand:- start:685 stop:936 length:252 start_codon:yes stop_codon:yes gene_type:complete
MEQNFDFVDDLVKWSPEFKRVYQKLYHRIIILQDYTNYEYETYYKMKNKKTEKYKKYFDLKEIRGPKTVGLSSKHGKFVILFD